MRTKAAAIGPGSSWGLSSGRVPRLRPISSAEIKSALPLLNNNESAAGQGWPSELSCYAYQEVNGEDGKVLKFHMLALPPAAFLSAAVQGGILPDKVKSSRVTLDKKKGKCEPAIYLPIAMGEPLCRF